LLPLLPLLPFWLAVELAATAAPALLPLPAETCSSSDSVSVPPVDTAMLLVLRRVGLLGLIVPLLVTAVPLGSSTNGLLPP
jgi:hypothetical protein